MYEFDYQRVHRLRLHFHNGCGGSEGCDFLLISIHDYIQELDKQRLHAFADFALDGSPRYDHEDLIHSYIPYYSAGTRTDHHEFLGDSAWYFEVSLSCYNEDKQSDQLRS